MKPIGRNFGGMVLVLGGFGMSFAGEPVGAVVCLVGAVLFDAIKTLNNDIER
jgi:hypothetical protein